MRDQAIEARVKKLLGPTGFAQACAPIDRAKGLPNAAYWSDEWLELEQERIFRRSWVFAGAAAEIPDIGDMIPLEIGGAPVVLLRDSAGKLRAFHNVCRHRGTKLVTGPCQQRVITCPYHAWCYGLDGRLRARPHFQGPDSHETLDGGGKGTCDLVPVRLEVWNGCAFLDLSGEAEPLVDWLAPLLQRCKGYDFGAIRWAGKIGFEVAANWKLVYENYMEGYHVFAVHPRLLEFAPMSSRWSGAWEDEVFYNDYLFESTEAGRGAGLPHYPGLVGDDCRRGLWFLGFPQFAAEVYPDQFTVLSARPLAPNRTEEALHIFLIGEAATSDRYAEARGAVFEMWDDLNREDLAMLERLQQGRRSPAFDGGHLSPHWEGPTHAFCRKVVEKILEAE